MSDSISNTSAKGISWNLIENIVTSTVRFGFGIILARLLSPSDFGLIAIIVVFFNVAEVFVNAGLGQSFIQKKNVNSRDANTVFIVNFCISALLFLILFFMAPIIADFYQENHLILLIRVMGISIIINSFNVIQVAMIRRQLAFKRKAIVTIISLFISGPIGITAAYYGYGVWSLVIQQMISRFLITIGLYYTSTWRFELKFSVDSFKSLLNFGLWLLGANILKMLFDNIYRLTIGKLYNPYELGLFTKARQFEGIISQQFSWSIGMVAFPVFSRLQDKYLELENVFMKFLLFTYFITSLSLSILFVVSEPLVILLLTDKWMAMIPYLQALCFVGMISSVYDLNTQLLQSKGKGKLVFNLSFIRNIFRVMNIIVVYSNGILLLIIGEFIITFISFVFNCYYINHYFHFGFKDQFNNLKPLIVCFLISIIAGTFLNSLISSTIMKLFAGALITPSVYLFTLFIIDRPLFLDAIRIKHYFQKH